jgi:hypothetical protein
LLLPDLKKVKINAKLNESRTLNDSLSDPTKNDDIKAHQTRTVRARKEE